MLFRSNGKKNSIVAGLNIDFNEYLNPLDETYYKDSLQKDKRKFLESFFDILKEDQLFFNTFFDEDNIKPKTIKIIYFVLIITFYFVINGFFYDESFITDLYHSNDNSFFSFLNGSIGRFISVTVIITVIDYLVNLSFSEEDEIKVILTEINQH